MTDVKLAMHKQEDREHGKAGTEKHFNSPQTDRGASLTEHERGVNSTFIGSYHKTHTPYYAKQNARGDDIKIIVTGKYLCITKLGRLSAVSDRHVTRYC